MTEDLSNTDGGSPPTGESASSHSTPDGPASTSLLDRVVRTTVALSQGELGMLDRFLAASGMGSSLDAWMGADLRASPYRPTRDDVVRRLTVDIATIDGLLTDQVNAILHHPSFQRFEASWRGLRYLVDKVHPDDNVRVRVLSISWRELVLDVTRAIEFDQSQLFQKIYSDEFGTAGGQPFGVLLGDYELRHKPSPDHRTDDLEALEGIGRVAAAAFAPFVAGAHPSFFGLDRFTELERPLNLPRTFEQLEYLKWRALRGTEDARFVGLTMPRVLARLPYEDDGSRVDGFRFREQVEGPDPSHYLWGTAVYAFGSVLVRAFAECGWLADIRGVRRDVEDGGLVTDLPLHEFGTDRPGVAPKFPVDVVITDDREKELGELGFIPLCACKDTPFCAFYANQSIQKPKKYDEAAATVNARISSMLQYMLCVSRFAHYIKVLGREKVGSFADASRLERFLNDWLQRYVTSDETASPSVKAQYPLREAKVLIRDVAGKPGSYMSVVHLRPHFQLDDLVASVKLVTEMSAS